jgi:hypothetical protein
MSKETLESIASFAEWGGVVLAAAGAVLLLMADVANRPIKRMLSAEVQRERRQAEESRLQLQARIAEAEARTKSLESANISVRRDLSSEVAKVAVVEKTASDAKAAQQRVELELSKQRELTAAAEARLLQLQQTIAWRSVSDDQKSMFVSKMWRSVGMRLPKIKVLALGDNPETAEFAEGLAAMLREAGYAVDYEPDITSFGPKRAGLSIATSSNRIVEAQQLGEALVAVGLAKPPIDIELDSTTKDNLVLVVGAKPR